MVTFTPTHEITLSVADGTTADARAALRRLEWELCVHRSPDSDRIVVAHDAEHRDELWLEVRDEQLRLTDGESAQPLPSDATSRQVRALATEWRACRCAAAPRDRR